MSRSVALTPWSLDDHDLLHALNSDPVQMAHVGGTETDAKIADRNARYAQDPHQLRIAVDGQPAGWVGFWEREWDGERVYEFGWSVLRAFQGRGVARQATLLALDVARQADGPRRVHAFPDTDNAPSNALCARVGFRLVGEARFEYPPGTFITVNDWRIDL
ncbi:GNAT family N-acetyltransferase [Baekduia sp.]|uniref:GNAT family N-acetyltransferase n=1 Tax=Baekduia sp. TaxID=2600305 RepID=UPI0032C21FDE